MEGMVLTFPIAWNGLIENRINRGQTNNINKVFGSDLDATDIHMKNTVIRYISGKLRIRSELTGLMFAFDNDEKIVDLVQRIHNINIGQIRRVVCAFELFLTTDKIKIWEPQRAMLDEALAKNDPELYVAYALIIGVRNREETKKLSEDDLKRLRNLDKDESIKIPDAFAEGRRRVAKQKEMAGPDDVVGDSLKLLWQKVREKEAKSPESISLRTLRILQQMNDAEAAICLKASKQLLDRDGHAWRIHLPGIKPDLMFFCLNDTHVVKLHGREHRPDNPANMYDYLEECGLVYSTPFTYEVDNIHENCLFATVGDNLGLRLQPTKDMQNIFNLMLADKNPQFYKCYNLTRAGQELFSCLELKTDREFFLDLCRKLKEMFKDFTFKVEEYTRTETYIEWDEISLEKEETPTD